jgi:dienelactone hydrolase
VGTIVHKIAKIKNMKNNPFTQKNFFWKIILLAILVSASIYGYQWLTYERPPLPEALAALESDDIVTVSRDPWLVFTPKSSSPTTGFIFYPGGRISYLGYSDFMKSIAAQGYLVVVPQMPFNIAAMNPNAADDIIAAHPEITHWVIGGHSVGGTMAAQYTKGNLDKIDGLVIWASYPGDNADISTFNIPVAVIYGSLDPNATEAGVIARKHLLPAGTNYIRIKGGDHHQFGSYALTIENQLATISRKAQQDQIIQATMKILALVSGKK